MLVVLDNAATEGQVVPLIPSSESCAVIINSRRRLGALDARTISLNLLDTTQATALVARVVGAERVEAEPAATADLVRLCGHPPLAIRVAAGRLATRPYWNVARMVDRLADEGRRLDNLAHGSLDVRASIMISYNSLSPAERHLLRGLGDLNLAEIAPWASAALLDAPVPRAEEVIDRLFDAQLIDVLDHGSVGYSRYRLHDLVRLVAQEQAGRAEPASARRSARERAYGSWLAVTEAVHRHVFGGDYETVRSSALRWTPDQDLIAVICAQPMRWFDLEQESLVAVVRRSIEDGLFEVAWSLTAVATRLVAVRGYYHDWSAVLRELQVATRKAGDVLGEAVTTCRLGYVLADLYDTKGAREQYQRALLLFQKTGNEHGCALVQLYLGAVERREGNLDAALRHYRAALPGLHTHGDLGAEAYALRSLAQVYMDRKEHGDAVEYFDRALAVARAAGSLRSEAQVTFWKGMYAMRLERYGAARDHFHDTLALARQVDDRYGVAQAIRGIGLCHPHQGDAAAATSALREALQVISQPMPTIIEIRIREALAAIEAGLTKA